MDFAGYEECVISQAIRLNSLFTFFKSKFSVGYTFRGESHDFYEAVCVLDGKVGVTADKKVFVLSAGQMIVHRPGEFHAIWSDYGSEPEIIIFSFRADIFPETDQSVFYLFPDQLAEIVSVFRTAEQAFLLEGIKVKSVLEGKALEAGIVMKRLELFLLTALYKKNPEKTELKGRIAENYSRILSVMERNLDRTVSVEEIACACALSVPTVEKTVFRFSGCGAMKYLNEMRMRKAVELLRQGLSVKEVALSLGFANQNYFSLRFKKWAGVSPSSISRIK